MNVQLPSDVGLGPQLITIATAAGTSASTVDVTTTQPGLLAPPSFKIAGKQYVAATIGTEGIYALPTGAIPGTSSRPARPGETLTLFGVGLGPVTPTISAGEVVRQNNTLTSSIEVLFGETPAAVSYSGLALLSVGLYQLNVVVPNVASTEPIPLSISVGGIRGSQALYTSVQD